MSDSSSLFAQRLFQLRQQKKLSQKSLAEQLRVSQSSISRYENGSEIPESNILIKLAQVLDVTTDYLLGITDHDTPLWLSRIQSQQEKELLNRFRLLTIKSQERVLGYVQCIQENHT